MTTVSPTTVGASREARNDWPGRLALESTESMVRTVTMVPSGIETVTGCGGGGGGGGKGAEGFSGAGSDKGRALEWEAEVGAGAGVAGGAVGDGLARVFGGFAGRAGVAGRGGGGKFSAVVAGSGGAMVVWSTTVFTPGVVAAIRCAARRAGCSRPRAEGVPKTAFSVTSAEADFNSRSE